MNAEPLACARVRVLLEPFVDGDLGRDDPKADLGVREHLASCADCRRQHEQATSLPHRLKALTAPVPRESLVGDVMRFIAPTGAGYLRAWALLVPEGVLATFILWYLSGLDGLSSIAAGVFGDLQTLVGWGSGSGSLPSVPPVDDILLIALIALTTIAAYHLSVLIRLVPGSVPTRRTARE